MLPPFSPTHDPAIFKTPLALRLGSIDSVDSIEPVLAALQTLNLLPASFWGGASYCIQSGLVPISKIPRSTESDPTTKIRDRWC